ncbi:hypothetical protein Lste_1756 [Legionella steelei]|uniref:Uncharacterized protein n=1 Tax=Legionella steelei TaxID=947033 RepID=A0A0W0ZIG0_9GAMM|nr:hypothetical protein [Legionella steelei]KTD68598.1 hypothetical protein Lste_1756 [Legionella steelei]
MQKPHNDTTFKNYPDINLIANEGLDKKQWVNLKKHIESVQQFLGIREGNNYASEWEKESFLKKINEKLQ